MSNACQRAVCISTHAAPLPTPSGPLLTPLYSLFLSSSAATLCTPSPLRFHAQPAIEFHADGCCCCHAQSVLVLPIWPPPRLLQWQKLADICHEVGYAIFLAVLPILLALFHLFFLSLLLLFASFLICFLNFLVEGIMILTPAWAKLCAS